MEISRPATPRLEGVLPEGIRWRSLNDSVSVIFIMRTPTTCLLVLTLLLSACASPELKSPLADRLLVDAALCGAQQTGGPAPGHGDE